MFVQDNQETGSQHMLRGTLQDQSHLSAWPSSGTRVSRTAATSAPVVNTGTTSWSGNSFSRLRRRGTRNPASVTAEAAVALSRYRTAIPAPEPVPVIRAKTGTRTPPGRIAGSNTLSARGPANRVAMGMTIQAIMRLAENTRPCSPAGTLACQMDWERPFTIVPTHSVTRKPAAHTNGVRPRKTHKPSTMKFRGSPSRMPRTLSLGPPHAPSRNPPSTPPIPTADWTNPSAVAFWPVRARIMGVNNGADSEIMKLETAKMLTRDSKGPRSRMNLNPNVICLHMDSWTDTSGTWRGIYTASRARTATPNVMMSMVMMPPTRMKWIRNPARIGAIMSEPLSASDMSPLARA